MIKLTSREEFIVPWQEILPSAKSLKGQNGKVLVIGGSELFHAPLKWILLVLSRMVDMVFCASTKENNELISEAKGGFWEGIVIARAEIEDYLEEADVVLIGPGMERQDNLPIDELSKKEWQKLKLSNEDWEKNTSLIVNYLLATHQGKKWIIDAGAIQMLDPKLLTETCVITPNQKEWLNLKNKIAQKDLCGGCILKGATDQIFYNGELQAKVTGGNAGMTKGGTGDCLAGLIAGLYAKTDSLSAMIVASEVCKKSGDELYEKVGPYFNATDLANKIPEILGKMSQ